MLRQVVRNAPHASLGSSAPQPGSSPKVAGASGGAFGISVIGAGHTGHAGHGVGAGHEGASTRGGDCGAQAPSASDNALTRQAKLSCMDGLWIILLEMLSVLAIAVFIVWWTMKK
jgi:hypothetical protein